MIHMMQLRNTKPKYGFRKVKYVAGLASAVLAGISISTAKPQTVHADTNTNNNLSDHRATGEKAAEEELNHIPDKSNSKTQAPLHQTSQKRTVHIIDDSTQQDLKQEKPVKNAINKNNTPNVTKSIVSDKDVETPKTTDKDYIPDSPKEAPATNIAQSIFKTGTKWTPAGWTRANPKYVAKSSKLDYHFYNNTETMDACYWFAHYIGNSAPETIEATIDKNQLIKGNSILLATIQAVKNNNQNTNSTPFLDSGYAAAGDSSIKLQNGEKIGTIRAQNLDNSEVDYWLDIDHTIKTATDPTFIWTDRNPTPLTGFVINHLYKDNEDVGSDYASYANDLGSTYQIITNQDVHNIIMKASPHSSYEIPQNGNWQYTYNDPSCPGTYFSGITSYNIDPTKDLLGVFKVESQNGLISPELWRNNIWFKALYHTVYNNRMYSGDLPSDISNNCNPFVQSWLNNHKYQKADNLSSQELLDQTNEDTVTYSKVKNGVMVAYKLSPKLMASGDANYLKPIVEAGYDANLTLKNHKQDVIQQTLNYYAARSYVPTGVYLNFSVPTTRSDLNDILTVTNLTQNKYSSSNVGHNANNSNAHAEFYRTIHVQYVDDDNKETIIGNDTVLGITNQDLSVNPINDLNIPANYVPINFDKFDYGIVQDKNNKTITIHVKHKIIGNVDNYQENAHNERDYLIDKIKSHQVKDLIDGLQDDSNKDLDQLSSNISIVQDPDQTYTAKYNDEADINNKLSQINNDYTKQQNDILNQLKDWSNKAKAYNAKRGDFINKLKQEGLWVKGMDPKDFKQNLHIGNEETATVTAEVLKNSGTVDAHGTHEGNNGYIFNSSHGADLSGDFLRLTYSNLKDSKYNGEAISKIVVTYHDAKDGSYSVFFKNNPIYGWNPGGNAAARIEFYDANGNLIHMHSSYLTVGSFNTWADDNYHEAAILESGGTPLQIPESSVTNHAGNLIYADKDNSSSVLFYYNNPNWDKNPNRVAQDQAYADIHYPQVWSHEIEKRYQGWDSSPSAPNRIFGAIMIKLDEGSSGIDIRPVAYNSNNGQISGIGNWFNWSTTVPQLSYDAQAPKLELHYHNDNLHLTKTSTYQVIEKMPHPTVDPNKYGNDQVILKTTITAGKDIARDMVTGETKQTKFLGKYTTGTVEKGYTDGYDQTVIWGSDVGLPGYELDPFYAETQEHFDVIHPQGQWYDHGAVLSVSDSGNTIHFDYLVGQNYYSANDVEMSDFPNDQTWYVTMHPLQQHVNIVYVDNDTNETVKTTPLQGLTDEQINLTYEAPANYTIAPNQDLPTNYLFTASDNSDIDVWLNHATKPTTQTHTAKRIFKLQFNSQDIKHDYVQTGTITRTGNQDLITGEIDYGDYSQAKWDEVTQDTLAKLYQQYGYQTNGHDFTLDGEEFNTINDVEIDPDTQDETHIINVVPTQANQPINYIDIATNNTVASDSVSGVTNAVIKYAPKVPYGYELVTPQASYSIPILGDNTPFDIYVKSSIIHIDHTKPHHKGELIYDDTQPNMVYPNNVDADDLNQTITRTINVYEPDGVITQIVQKVVLYRDADYDLVHHTTTYTPWQANGSRSWDSYTAPDFDGYTPDVSYISTATPLPDSQDVTRDIHYKETGSEVLLAYNDTDESGTEISRYNEGGKPRSTIQIDWINHITQDMPGYEIVPGQVINGQHLDDLLNNHEALTYTLSDINRPIVINIRHITSDVTNTDPKAKSSSERTLTIIEPNGHTIVYTQHVDFIRTATLDHATGLVSYGNWHVSGGYEADTNGEYKAIPANNNQSTYTVNSLWIPAFANYETQSNIIDNNGNTLTDPDLDNSLPSITVSPDSPARNYLVTYHNKMNYYYFVDDDNDEQLVDGIYAFSPNSNHTYHTTITPPSDYQLVNPSDADFTYNFDQGKTDVPIAIHIHKGTSQTGINGSIKNNGIKQIITIHSNDGSTKMLNRIINSNKLANNFIKNAINLLNYQPEVINKKVGNTLHTDLYYVAKNSIKDVKQIKSYHYVPHFAPTTVKLYTYVPHFAPTVIKAYQSIPTFGTKLRKANMINPALLGFKQNIQVQKPHNNLATLGLMTTMLSLLSK